MPAGLIVRFEEVLSATATSNRNRIHDNERLSSVNARWIDFVDKSDSLVEITFDRPHGMSRASFARAMLHHGVNEMSHCLKQVTSSRKLITDCRGRVQ